MAGRAHYSLIPHTVFKPLSHENPTVLVLVEFICLAWQQFCMMSESASKVLRAMNAPEDAIVIPGMSDVFSLEPWVIRRERIQEHIQTLILPNVRMRIHVGRRVGQTLVTVSTDNLAKADEHTLRGFVDRIGAYELMFFMVLGTAYFYIWWTAPENEKSRWG